jgi:hypothetical protein
VYSRRVSSDGCAARRRRAYGRNSRCARKEIQAGLQPVSNFSGATRSGSPSGTRSFGTAKPSLDAHHLTNQPRGSTARQSLTSVPDITCRMSE